jgi:hypothetical protein
MRYGAYNDRPEWTRLYGILSWLNGIHHRVTGRYHRRLSLACARRWAGVPWSELYDPKGRK